MQIELRCQVMVVQLEEIRYPWVGEHILGFSIQFSVGSVGFGRGIGIAWCYALTLTRNRIHLSDNDGSLVLSRHSGPCVCGRWCRNLDQCISALYLAWA